jgi:hypothetical protein
MNSAILDHPAIRNAELTGWPHGEPNWPRCPVCGCEAGTFYRNADLEIVGCDECVSMVDAWEVDPDEM